MTMRAALKTSSNRAAVRMLEDVGIPVTVQYAKRLGVGSVPSVPSLALGSGEVTLSSMTAAYAAFANAGMVQAPILVRRVETTDGEVLFTAKQEPQRGVSEETAFLMSNMMADVINAGTGAAAPQCRVPPACCREDRHDQRLPRRVVRRLHAASSRPASGSGTTSRARSSVAATRRCWRCRCGDASWRRPRSKDRPEWFSTPATVTSATICRLSGKLATDSCHEHVTDARGRRDRSGPMVYTEYFVAGHGTHRVVPDSSPDHHHRR